MKKNSVFLLIIILLVIAGVAYAVHMKKSMQAPSDAPLSEDAQTQEDKPRSGKVRASTEEDGEYFVQMGELFISPEDAIASFEHVTLFEGNEAKAAAKADPACAESATCATTLKLGYYVRPSGAPTFTAPLLNGTKISLKADSTATVDQLKVANDANIRPVYLITIKGGAITSIEQKR